MHKKKERHAYERCFVCVAPGTKTPCVGGSVVVASGTVGYKFLWPLPSGDTPVTTAKTTHPNKRPPPYALPNSQA